MLPRGRTSALQLTSVILTKPFKGPSSRREPDAKTQPISQQEMSRSARLNRMFTRHESTQTGSSYNHRQANRNKGVDRPASQLPRYRASVGSTEASDGPLRASVGSTEASNGRLARWYLAKFF